MLKNLLLALTLVFAASSLQAGEDPPVKSRLKTADEKFLPEADRKPFPDKVILPFWEIGLSKFEAMTPRPISIPRKFGKPEVYWYWPFRFRAVTSLEYVKDSLKEVIAKDDTRETNLAYYRQHLARIEKSLSVPRVVRMFVVIHADTGEILPDESNPAVRNLIERKLHRRLYTTAELAKLTLKNGQEVNGVAIFPRLNPRTTSFEIRVYGMGKRFLPSYEPSSLLYLDNPSVFHKTLRRALRFTYERIGNDDERLAQIEIKDKKADWIWLWASQIYAGRWRKIVIKRDTDLKDKDGNPIILSREYRYVPYKIWNDTHQHQELDVMKAGLRFSIRWKGERIKVTMPDIGDPDDFWKTQVDRIWKERIESGWEKEFVEKYEKPGVGSTGEEVEQDLEAKAKILPESGIRHPKGIINPLQMMRGMIVVRWGIANIRKTVDTLIKNLRIKALTADAGNVEGDLLKAYIALRDPKAKDKPHWMRPPDPARDKVLAMLLEQAQKDLQARDAKPSEDDRRRYGKLAPIGTLLNLIAADYVQKRADGGQVEWKSTPERGNLIDLYFEVKWDGVIDRSSFLCNFKRRLPLNLAPYPQQDIDINTFKAQGAGLGDDDDDEGDDDDAGDDDDEGEKADKDGANKDKPKEKEPEKEANPWD